MYDFDTHIDRKGTGCFKYDGLQQVYGDSELLPLWVADMDFAVSPQIQAAIARRAAHPVFGYNFRMPALKEALVYWQKARHGWDVSGHHLSVLPSLMTALAYTIMAHTQPGDGILIQSPVYPPFHNSVKEQRRKLLVNSLVNDDGYYRIDFEDFEAKAREARLFILCNPHNPVGRVFTEDELRSMADICYKHNVIIFSDEIHADLVYDDNKHIPIAQMAEDITLTGISPAKSFNLAGMGTAALISQNKELLKQVDHFNVALHTFMGNSFGIAAFTAAYSESESWLEDLLVYLQANRDYFQEHMAKELPRIKLSPIEGTFLAWLDMRDYGISESEIMRRLKEECGLALNAGSSFGSEGEGFVRLNFGCPRATLTEAIARLKRVFKERINAE